MSVEVKYAGVRYGEDRSGERLEVQFKITGASNPYYAAHAPGLPQYGDMCNLVLAGKEVNLPIMVIDRRIEPISDKHETIHKATIVYGLPGQGSGNSYGFNPKVPLAVWNIGLTSSRELVSMLGYSVGSSIFAELDGTFNDNNKRVDEQADLGYERMIPTIDITVRNPSPETFNPLEVASVAGCCNDGSYEIQDVVFPPGTLMFLGAEATPIGPTSKDYEKVFKFMAGYKIIADNIPLFIEDGNVPYQGPRMFPLQYGIWPRWHDLREPGVVDPRLFKRIPVAFSVFKAQPSASFEILRINW